MKVLLIRYHDKENINTREIKSVVGHMGIWPPLGLLYLGVMLKRHGYEVEILDVIQRRLDSAGARKVIHESNADLIGITTTTPEIRGVMEAACFAKETGAKVVMGGPHIGIFPYETLSFPEVDFAIEGDGEIPLLCLAETLSSAKPDFSAVPGLIYKENGRVCRNDVYVERNLDNMPFPDWSLLNINSYSRADAVKPLATMISARGCPYKCGFCYRGVGGMQTRFRNPISVVDEMEYLSRNWGVREIIFCNDTLTLNRRNIMTTCEEILRRNLVISWQGATRVDAVDPEMLKLMKRAGCKQLKFGIESGNPRILLLMKKEIGKEQALKAFRWCKREKIRIGAYFILGYIDENEQTMQDSVNFAKELDPDFVMFYAGIPLPDTNYHDLAVEKKKIDPNYWRDYVLEKRSDKIPYVVPDLERWIQRAFREFYGRPLFLARKLCNLDIWLSVIKRPHLLLGLFFPRNYG